AAGAHGHRQRAGPLLRVLVRLRLRPHRVRHHRRGQHRRVPAVQEVQLPSAVVLAGRHASGGGRPVLVVLSPPPPPPGPPTTPPTTGARSLPRSSSRGCTGSIGSTRRRCTASSANSMSTWLPGRPPLTAVPARALRPPRRPAPAPRRPAPRRRGIRRSSATRE